MEWCMRDGMVEKGDNPNLPYDHQGGKHIPGTGEEYRKAGKVDAEQAG